MKLICEEIHEPLNVITEDVNGRKNYFIEGVFMQANVKNKNGRIYPRSILEREADRYSKNYIQEKRAYGELGHPAGPTINLPLVSHMIHELRQDGDTWIGKAKILDTPNGTIVQNLMREGAKLGVSSRGMGSLQEKNGIQEVQSDYYLATPADIVADPSAPAAFVRGIMEGREWVYESGVWKEVELASAKKQINEAVLRRETDKVYVRLFENFISKL